MSSVVDPVGEGKIVDDGDLKLPAGVVKVRGTSHCQRVTTDGGNGIAEVFPGFDGSRSRNSTTLIEMSKRQLEVANFLARD